MYTGRPATESESEHFEVRFEWGFRFEVRHCLCYRSVFTLHLQRFLLLEFHLIFNGLAVLGDAKKQVHMEGYAVSAQCMALVRDNCLVPTKDAPELGYIRESTDKQFVPDVYYKVSGSFFVCLVCSICSNFLVLNSFLDVCDHESL